MIKIGSGDIAKVYVGSTEIAKAYVGSQLVYENGPAPLYDKEVEYLQTDGNAYINTGYAPSAITPILETRIYLPTTSTNMYVVGSDGSGNTRFSIGRLTSNRIEFRIGSYKNVGSKTANWYTIKLNGSNGQASLDGTVQWTSSVRTFYSQPILLFTGNYLGNPRTPMLSGVRISSFKLWDGDTLLLDFLPVRKGSVGYMYDKVSGELFGNAGTGSFILGNDV